MFIDKLYIHFGYDFYQIKAIITFYGEFQIAFSLFLSHKQHQYLPFCFHYHHITNIFYNSICIYLNHLHSYLKFDLLICFDPEYKKRIPVFQKVYRLHLIQ
jgi:hypothetical protein